LPFARTPLVEDFRVICDTPPCRITTFAQGKMPGHYTTAAKLES
jgi:hypothetical protein